MRIVLGRLEVDWEVAGDFVEKGLCKLIEDLGGHLLVKGAIWVHVRAKHEVGQVKAQKQVARVFLSFDSREHALYEDDWVGDLVKQQLLLHCELLVDLENCGPGALVV